jgi:DNA modification methylase
MDLQLNKIYNMDCLEGMRLLDGNSIDLTVTSPPYDNLRTYNGNIEQWSFEKFQAIAKELYRVTKPGGVVVWVVGDATIKGSESGSSFKQALYFKEIGFNLHDTMIYRKINYVPLTHNRYEQEFEYMFVFSKGKPKTFNPIKIPCKTAGAKTSGRTFYQTNNQNIPTAGHKNNTVSVCKQKGNVWELSTNSGIKGHPAPFPEQLAQDHIISWSNPNDIILDPFMGSGTTGKMAYQNNRNYIGFEISSEYCDIANKRIEDVKAQIRMEV